jgi:medium-chain acyl-[acyl-carrier-protein] hydrolase
MRMETEPVPRLLCYPYAGGGAGIYRGWDALATGRVAVVAAQLPGRERRYREPPHRRLEPLAERLVDEMVADRNGAVFDRPYAVFGHSMGGLVAFEVARAARRRGLPGPALVAASGVEAPDYPPSEPPLHLLDDEEFATKIEEMGGTPREVLDNPELMRVVLPILRADCEACETYEPAGEPPLDCPIVAFRGEQDTLTHADGVEQWANHTTGRFRCVAYEGDHFFFRDRREDILAEIVSDLSEITSMRAVASANR